jgi:hypothetical protein
VACLAGGALALLVGVLVTVVGAPLSTCTSGVPGLGVLAGPSRPSAPPAGQIPPDQAGRHAPGGCQFPALSALDRPGRRSRRRKHLRQEHGRSSAGAVSYRQFLPTTWAACGASGNPRDYRDAFTLSVYGHLLRGPPRGIGLQMVASLTRRANGVPL